MSGNKWIWNAVESTLLQVNISSANFRYFDLEQSGIRFEIGFCDLTHLDWRVWAGDYGDQWHCDRRYCIKRRCHKVDIEKYKEQENVRGSRIQLQTQAAVLQFPRAPAI